MSGRRRIVGHSPRRRSPTLDELIDLARRFGRDPDFSRGGGGNASAKVDGVLYIKPSGVALATLAADDLVPLDMEPLLELLHAGGWRRRAHRLPGRATVRRTRVEPIP